MELLTGSEGVVRRPVEVESDGVTLRGWLIERASRSESIPAVAMIHGFSATIDGWWPIDTRQRSPGVAWLHSWSILADLGDPMVGRAAR
jgi:dipeptidyl aminopeptidase/acylaminoacyl peptidase